MNMLIKRFVAGEEPESVMELKESKVVPLPATVYAYGVHDGVIILAIQAHFDMAYTRKESFLVLAKNQFVSVVAFANGAQIFVVEPI